METKKKFIWIGLTGGLGSGKSTFAHILKEMGFTVISADVMAYKAVEPGTLGLKKIAQEFGPEFLNPKGELLRKKLGQYVFADKEKLKKLESFIHPEIKTLVEKQKQEALARGEKILFYDVPLLFEKHLKSNFDMVIVVNSSQENQIHRTMSRDGLNKTDVLQRMSHQIPLEEKCRAADFVIDNNGSIENLKVQAQKLISQLKKLVDFHQTQE
ncbi:MAG: dephospho-CoA kinase [Bdellovibrionales bacterium]|nr:dephospho-CoA kinase [Bdellovibrionales bacterium]